MERLLAVPEMAWLIARVRARLLAAGDEALTGVVRLDAPSAEQRAAAVKVVGRPKRPGSALRVDLAEVEAILRRGPWPAGLGDAVVTLTGPVVDRAGDRKREAVAWASARSGAVEAIAAFPGLGHWWDDWCAGGGLKRAARSEAVRLGAPPGPDVAERLVEQLAAVLDSLPAAGVPLAVFARQVVGDAHGLDASRPLGRLGAAVVGAAFGPGGPPPKEPSARDAWGSAGVVMSNVSSTALALGVPGATEAGPFTLGSATATMLEAMRTARAPMLLTLDQVRSGGVAALPRDRALHVCENPTIVEVVTRHWASSPASHHDSTGPVLVCTSGQPSTAVIELLQILTSGGARCLYHGDFDWGGLRIAQSVRTRIPWSPWRFTASDYWEATRRDGPSLRLIGSPAEAPWDPDLAPAMIAQGLAVEEEAIADLLTDDLLTPDP